MKAGFFNRPTGPLPGRTAQPSLQKNSEDVTVAAQAPLEPAGGTAANTSVAPTGAAVPESNRPHATLEQCLQLLRSDSDEEKCVRCADPAKAVHQTWVERGLGDPPHWVLQTWARHGNRETNAMSLPDPTHHAYEHPTLQCTAHHSAALILSPLAGCTTAVHFV